MDTSQNLTGAEIDQELDLMAKKFAYLLASSDMEEELQEAFITALPHLSLEQITHLVAMLEAKYAASKTQSLDEELKGKLEAIAKSFNDRQTAREDELIASLNNVAADPA
jgi:hypothetical protein